MGKVAQNSNPTDTQRLARATESSIWQCLANANKNPPQENHWRNHADRLEQNFTYEFGRHYTYFLTLDIKTNGHTE